MQWEVSHPLEARRPSKLLQAECSMWTWHSRISGLSAYMLGCAGSCMLPIRLRKSLITGAPAQCSDNSGDVTARRKHLGPIYTTAP